jgi:sigma-B regulation protein RsbU (phosphoserine phosphatase)
VIWLKYARPHPEPTPRTVFLATGFADNAGLVIDFLRRAEKKVSKTIEQFKKKLFPAFSLACPQLEGHVVSQPCEGQIGGDFYAFQSLDGDNQRVGILVGDIEGHGMSAALEMLPVFTTFRTFARQTSSTKYILEKLIQVSAELDIQGSALYFVIDLEEKPPLLFASSAGHESLLIIGRKETRHFPAPDSPAVHQRLGVASKPSRLAEDVFALSPGDLIIAYTDGISEAGVVLSREPFGRRGIEITALRHLRDTPMTIAKAIYDEARLHGGGQLHDDATVMVLKLG